MKLKIKKRTLQIVSVIALILVVAIVAGVLIKTLGSGEQDVQVYDAEKIKSTDTQTVTVDEDSAIEAKKKSDEVVSVSEGKKVLMKTSLGDITIELAEDMPITAGNFEKLVRKGFYDGVIFHRIIENFMVQGGDPTGTGTGGPGYKIKDEFNDNNKNDRGTLSMANAGPNTGGSQFFINLVNNNFLDDKHPVFGKVVEGMDVVDKMAKVKKGPGDRPVEEVKIISAEMIE